jgi:DNA-binding PadR family transcriptional regulator
MVRTETENVNNRIRKYYSLTPKGKKVSDIRMLEFREYIDLMKNLFY